MDDLISRQAAIDEVKRLHDVALANWKETRISANTMIDALKDLPSAQPEIIQCKDCKHYKDGECTNTFWGMCERDYCSEGERRTDG